MVAKTFAFAVLVSALLFSNAAWSQTGDATNEVAPADELYRIQLELEQVITGLALADNLDTTAVDGLRRELARLYHDVERLAKALGATPPQSATPPPDPAIWQPYSAASKQAFPSDAEFSGWSLDSNLGVEMGGYGQIMLRIENSYYLAEWNIQGGYNGQGTASVSANAEGDVLLVVKDSQGSREFKLDKGGLGTAFMRMLEKAEPQAEPIVEPVAEPVTEPEAVVEPEIELPAVDAGPVGEEPAGEETPTPVDIAEVDTIASAVTDTTGEWYTPYLDQVRSGKLESSQAMQWFITQATVHNYEADALRDLGEALNRMGGGAGTVSAIGEFVFYQDSERQATPIPDPRTDPLGFSHIINKAYILNLEGKLYSVEMK